MVIRTPDSRLRVFISSTLHELGEERKAARQAVLELHLAPVMFESGARPHPAQVMYRSYLSQSQVFIGIYWQNYGWIGPDMSISGLEDEYNLSANMPRLIYIKNPAPNREPALNSFLERLRDDNSACYTYFSTPVELKELIQNDLALLLTERFEGQNSTGQSANDKLSHPLTNIPIPRNPLVNRQQELTTAHSLLLQVDIALITLTGAGGTGKSRLALQIGIEMLEHFKDGVYLVSLEAIRDASLVIPTVGETLGIRVSSGSRPVDEMLIEFLRDKEFLLLLDNFEQVVEVAPFLARLLEACPRLKSVVTSRVPLHLRAETIILVPPLAVPAENVTADLNHLSQYAAVELFVQRARAVKPNFSMTDQNATAVAEICHRLDGLPLAIELAAARIKLLTPQELLTRLDNRFDLLRNGPRDLPERQRTLREAIDWSYNLLTDDEKKLYRRLAIFVGGWTFEAAQAVCSAESDSLSDLDDTLTSLYDNNLIMLIQETDESERFGMLSTIHEYAFERLEESGDTEAIRSRHAQYYRNFVRQVEPLIRSAERVHWQQVMQHELGNIRGVLEWISTSGNCLEIGQEIVITLGMLWVTSGYFAEGEKWCKRILSLSGDSASTAVRAALLGIEGLVAWAQGEYASGRACLDESLVLLGKMDLKTSEEKHLLAQALFVRGMLASATRDLETAATVIQRSIELFEETNDQWFEAIAFSWLGEISIYKNDRERAKELRDQSIKLARAQGDPWCLVPALMSSARVALVDGDLAKSRSILQEGISLLRKTGDLWSLSFALNDLGHVMLIEAEYDQARFCFLEALTLGNTLGNLRVLVVSLAGAAALIARQPPLPPKDSQPAHLSAGAQAACLCGATVPHVSKPGVFIWLDTKMIYDQSIAQVQSLVEVETWEKNYSEGQSMALDQAVPMAIQSLENLIIPQPLTGPSIEV